MSTGGKNEILKNLSLYADEPDKTSDLFQFKVFAEQLAGLLLDENLHTPYSIAIHGDWGSGKTSLLGRVFDLVKSNSDRNQWKIVWFNAWEYENLDPMLALMQTITLQYKNVGAKIKNVIKGFLLMSADIVLRSETGLSLEEVQQRFENVIDDIPSLNKDLEQMIGEKARLVVFIDDLDRCSVDNVLKVLEAVKLFLNAKRSIFVVAVDVRKLERAWELRYGNVATSLQEGKDHIDKIFPLKLSLPPKGPAEIKQYVSKLSQARKYS